MKLTCDDCGSVQSNANERCELCGGSLSEERERAERGSILMLLPAAIAATVFFCLGPGILIRHFYFDEWSDGLFWGVYAAVWVIGSFVSQYYRPKDDYYLGWRGRGGYVVDNPFTFRDDVDRSHLGVGLALFPITVVSGLWVACFKSFTGR